MDTDDLNNPTMTRASNVCRADVSPPPWYGDGLEYFKNSFISRRVDAFVCGLSEPGSSSLADACNISPGVRPWRPRSLRPNGGPPRAVFSQGSFFDESMPIPAVAARCELRGNEMTACTPTG